MKEEKTIKARIQSLEKELEDARELHRDEVQALNAEIELWMQKYELDMQEQRTLYIQLSDFTDIERKVSE